MPDESIHCQRMIQFHLTSPRFPYILMILMVESQFLVVKTLTFGEWSISAILIQVPNSLGPFPSPACSTNRSLALRQRRVALSYCCFYGAKSGNLHIAVQRPVHSPKISDQCVGTHWELSQPSTQGIQAHSIQSLRRPASRSMLNADFMGVATCRHGRLMGVYTKPYGWPANVHHKHPYIAANGVHVHMFTRVPVNFPLDAKRRTCYQKYVAFACELGWPQFFSLSSAR